MKEASKSRTSSGNSREEEGAPSNLDAGERGGQMSETEIDYNIMETFPASDPPSWTLGIGPNRKPHEDFEGEKPSAEDPSHPNEPIEPS